jgi:hypothetical protein
VSTLTSVNGRRCMVGRTRVGLVEYEGDQHRLGGEQVLGKRCWKGKGRNRQRWTRLQSSGRKGGSTGEKAARTRSWSDRTTEGIWENRRATNFGERGRAERERRLEDRQHLLRVTRSDSLVGVRCVRLCGEQERVPVTPEVDQRERGKRRWREGWSTSEFRNRRLKIVSRLPRLG